MPLGNPGVPGANLPAGEDWVPRRFADIERTIMEMQANVTRIGLIDNAALTSPAEFGQSSVTANGIGFTTSFENYAGGYIPVPAGYSRALVTCIVTAGAVNSTASYDYLTLAANIAGGVSRQMFAGTTPGGAASITTSRTALLEGLSGGDIYVSARVFTQLSTWGVNASNRAYTEASVVFLR